MEILNETPWTFAYLAGRQNYPDHSLTLIVKATYDLHPGEAPAIAAEQQYPTGDIFYPDDEEGAGAPRYESDFVHRKPRADVMLVGICHPPNGPTGSSVVKVSVGKRTKTLAVFGDRVRSGNSVTKPKTFTEMPIRYEVAYGGAADPRNPIGKGHVTDEDSGQSVALPNVEDSRRPTEPAGLGPLNRMWQERYAKVGSYGDDWGKTRWPWVAEDFDWAFCNAAPRDQQVDGYLAGDENLLFENLHSEHAEYRSWLPGRRARCFVNVAESIPQRVTGPAALEPLIGPDTPTQFREVSLVLDTLWIDMEAERLVLTWRGSTPVHDEDLGEVAHIYVIDESVDDPRPPLADCEQRFRDAWAAVLAEGEEDEPEEVDGGQEDDEDGFDEDAELADLAKRIEEIQAEFLAELPEGFDPSLPAPEPPPLSDDVRAALAEMEATEAREDAEVLAAVPEPELVPEDEPLTRGSVERRAGTGDSFADEDMSGLDLSALALSSVEMTGAILSGANLAGCDLAGAKLGGADLGAADLSSAKLQGADFREADLTGANLSGADLHNAQLGDAILDGADLAGANLAGVEAPGASCVDATFHNAILTGAKLAGADFSHANLDGANLAEAILTEACFEGAVGIAANLGRTDLSAARMNACDMTDARFDDCVAPDSIWERAKLDGASYARATLMDANFSGADLIGADFEAAECTGAKFPRASLRGARMKNVNLFEGNLEKADLSQADFSGSNLYAAELLDAKLDQTRLISANLKLTRLVDTRGGVPAS